MKTMALKFSAFESSWGWIAASFSDLGLIALTLPQQTRFRAEESLAYQVGSSKLNKIRNDAVEIQMGEYLAGKRRVFELPLDLSLGTPFQQAVWNAAACVPFGEQRSYSWVARKIRSPMAMRAVGSALGSNPIAIIVPCHRIVRNDGRLGGYGGGLPMKRRLLELEAQEARKLALLPD